MLMHRRARTAIILLWLAGLLAFGYFNVTRAPLVPQSERVLEEYMYLGEMQVTVLGCFWLPVTVIFILVPALLIEDWVYTKRKSRRI